MEVGIIAPIKLLREYCTTRIQYCLPELIVESKEYRSFYKEKATEGKLVIMDIRKIGWKREPEDFRIVKEALKHLRACMIIYPSCMYNWKKTMKVVRDFKKTFRLEGVGCLEGTNKKELTLCAHKLIKEKVTTLAIPSHIYNLRIKDTSFNKPIMYIDNYSGMDELVGLDGILVTSLPVRLGLEGKLLSNYKPSPPSLTFYETEDPYPMITKKNVKEAIRYYQT